MPKGSIQPDALTIRHSYSHNDSIIACRSDSTLWRLARGADQWTRIPDLPGVEPAKLTELYKCPGPSTGGECRGNGRKSWDARRCRECYKTP